MEARKITNEEDWKKYDALAQKSGSVFNSIDWLKIYGQDLSLIGIFQKDDSLAGAFFIYESKSYGIKRIKNPPFTPHIGLIYDTPTQNSSKLNTEFKKICSIIIEFLKSRNSHLVTLNFPYPYHDFQKFYWSNYKVIPNYTYLIDLSKSEEDIQAQFSSKRRNDIKKAVKDGVEIRMTEDYKLVKQMIGYTYDRKNKDLKSDALDKILFNYAHKNNSLACISYYNGKPSSAVFIVYDKNTAFYLLGGYDPKNSHRGASALALQEAIIKSKKMNLKTFDFEGSMLPEVEEYFRDFGGEITPIFSISKSKFPFNIILNLRYPNRF